MVKNFTSPKEALKPYLSKEATKKKLEELCPVINNRLDRSCCWQTRISKTTTTVAQ